MVSVLGLIGYGPVESLQFFISRFTEQPCSITDIDEELENVWVSHKNVENLRRFQMGLPHDHFKMKCNKVHAYPFTELDFVLRENAQNQFNSLRILKGIMKNLHCCLAEYIITECLVLYNWGINSFELVLDNEEFCVRLLKNQNDGGSKKVCQNDEEDFRKWRMILTSQMKNVNKDGMRRRRNSCDLFEEEETKMLRLKEKRKRKRSNYRELKRIYKKYDRPIRWDNGSSLDVFNKDSILYDIRQRLWPKGHALSAKTQEEFLNAIMRVEIKEKTNYGNGLSYPTRTEWKCLKRILGLILKNHKELTVFDGYRRLLKRHLKITGFSTENRTLKPIPSNTVSSYIAIIIHKVVPMEFFGSNRVRKKFFREISRIVNVGKCENFILKPVIQAFWNVKRSTPWIREIQNWETARRIISKIIKWMLLNYIFIILKNNFYLTDVGSKGYRLYYYRKCDVESAVAVWMNKQIRLGNLRMIRGNFDHWTSIERNWLETGKVELNGNYREMNMSKSTEYIYPVANARFLPKTEESSDLRLITSYRIKKTVLRKSDSREKKLVSEFMDRQVKRLLLFRKVKLLMRFLTDKYGSGIKPLPNNPKLELAWAKAVHLKDVYGKLYYVKADVRDAFGSVVPSLLVAIIEEKLRSKCNRVVQLQKMKECRARNGRIECVIRKSFSDRPMENSLLVSRSIFVGSRKKLPSYDSAKLKRVLDQIILHQYIRLNGKHYRLMRGLPQGSAGSISPFLCDVYYSEMDRVYFREFTECSNCVLLRAVDDYLLLTSDIDKATKFYDIVYNGIKDFNVTFNRSKLKSNITDDSSSAVSYLGLIFDVKDSSVRPDYTRYTRKDLLSSMKLSDQYGTMFTRRMRFIRYRSTEITSLKLLPVTLNTVYNAVSVVREIVYSASVVQSNRVLALTRHLTRGNDINDLDVCVILSTALRKISGVVTRFNRDVTKFEIQWLFWNAALDVFRKCSGTFTELLTVIRHRVNVLEESCLKDGYDRLLQGMKTDMEGDSWREMMKTLKVIMEKSKPSRRFR